MQQDLNAAGNWQALPFGQRYQALLLERIEGRGGEPKRERTRARLTHAAMRLLIESRGDLSGLTIAAITREAGVATGTFYVHFTAVRELMLEMIREFIEIDIRANLPDEAGGSSLFLRTRDMFVDAVQSFRTLRGIFAAVMELRRSDDEVNRLWLGVSLRWARALAHIARRHDPGRYSLACMEMLGLAASGVADDLLKSIYIDEIFGAEFALDPGNDIHVAELMALVRHRILFGRDPAPEEISDWCRTEGRMLAPLRFEAPQASPLP